MRKTLDMTFFRLKISIVFFFLVQAIVFSQSSPEITATGNQAFCIGSPINIVEDFTITDADDTTINEFFIQISEGYQTGSDFLELVVNYPSITTSWDANEGKLTLSAATSSGILLTTLEDAVKDVVFTSSIVDNVLPEKIFSLTTDDTNYLPATGNFYEFIPNEGISWSAARAEAETRFYNGRQGYLATLTSQEEANFAGKQASGAGWIGGSDQETEGVWRWVTGPEAGTIFWNGAITGTTPNFAFWNNNEPNDQGGNEDYAHITDPSIGIPGAWNDLPNQGGSGLYAPKGYIVEYGTPSDPPLNIVASTRIYVPQITSTTPTSVCEGGIATISAIASEGTIEWFDNPNRGSQPPIFVGDEFSITVTETTIFYASINLNGCNTYDRIPVTVTVNERPEITNVENDLICSGTAVLGATASVGEVFWFADETSTTPIFTGDNFQTPPLTSTTSYFVEANIDGCNSLTRTEVIAVVDDTVPQFNVPFDPVILCEDVGSIDISALNPADEYSYIWEREGNRLTFDTQTISINEAGTYTVAAVSEAGCISDKKTITVQVSEQANITINDVIITDDSNNNSIQVANPNLGIGDYEFALDDINGDYQEIGFFQNLSTGIHTLFVRDKGGCGIASLQFSILAYPKFFSPNGDNRNDVWKLSGFDSSFYTVSDIEIYDRFGNLIHTIIVNDEGWNGTNNGKELPANTYWFRTFLTDINGRSVEKIGNFSLIR